ncbi:MAG: hypothetical protein ABI402_08140 [Ferruginibacter sp.]
MKKVFFTVIGISVSMLTIAQVKADSNLVHQPNIENTSLQDTVPFAVLGFFLLVGYFILKAVKLFFDNRLKNKIIDKGISEQLAVSILQNKDDDKKKEAIKWVFLLVGIGMGLSIIYKQLPLGIHSAAIMAFSIAASFLGYYLYLKYSKN